MSKENTSQKLGLGLLRDTLMGVEKQSIDVFFSDAERRIEKLSRTIEKRALMLNTTPNECCSIYLADTNENFNDNLTESKIWLGAAVNCLGGAKTAIEKKDIKLLFGLLMGAQGALGWSAGTVASVNSLTKSESEIKKQIHREIGRLGAEGRGAKYQPLRVLAFKLVKARKWKSRRNAAKTIKPEILRKAKELEIPLSEDQAEITITGWLKKEGLPANI